MTKIFETGLVGDDNDIGKEISFSTTFVTLDDFQNSVGDKIAKPYLPFLKDLTANDEHWSFLPKMGLLRTKYGCEKPGVWEFCQERDNGKYLHPVKYWAEKRTSWLSLFSVLREKAPDYEEINGRLEFLWRPCRVEGLIELLDFGLLRHLTDAEYWTLVKDYWSDSESNSADWDAWSRLFEEREADSSSISHLPDEVTIYRGGDPNGVSWTTSFETASWFRFSSRKHSIADNDIWTTTIPKHKIIFYTNNREENEVVLRGTLPTNTIKVAKPKFAKVA